MQTWNLTANDFNVSFIYELNKTYQVSKLKKKPFFYENKVLQRA